MSNTTDYRLCGWCVRSALSLPELPIWSGSATTPDIAIVYTTVPPIAEDAPFVHVRDDGATTVTVPDVGRFLVLDGRYVAIEPTTPIDEAALRLFILGTVFAILCYQRDVVPFHASCLVPDPNAERRAIMISGDSGAGKSTFAATLALRGAPILADDVCVIDLSSPVAMVIPSITRLKLWRDTLERLAIPIDTLARVRNGIDKYAWHGAPTSDGAPIPLAAVYYLVNESRTLAEMRQPMSGISAIQALSQCVYRPYIGTALGRESLITQTLMKVLASTPVFKISRELSTHVDQLLLHERREQTQHV